MVIVPWLSKYNINTSFATEILLDYSIARKVA